MASASNLAIAKGPFTAPRFTLLVVNFVSPTSA